VTTYPLRTLGFPGGPNGWDRALPTHQAQRATREQVFFSFFLSFFVPARQVLYHLGHTPGLFALVIVQIESCASVSLDLSPLISPAV
jgi:hypothetical protein